MAGLLVEVEGVAQFLSTYTVAIEETKKSLRRSHTNRTHRLYRRAEEIFKERIGRPPYARVDRTAVSASLGGVRYRPDSRATGRFTFGPNGAFQARVFAENNGLIQGIGFPVRSIADARTDNAWRALEYGMSSVRMPRGVWLGIDGNYASRREASAEWPIFRPIRNRADIRGGPIRAKLFLKDAFQEMVQRMPEDYQVIVDEVWQARFRRR